MSTRTQNLGLFKYDTVKDSAVPFSIDDALNANWDILDQNIGSRNIGEIVTSTIPLTDAGLHLLDGSLISGTGTYAHFVTYIAGLVSTYPDLFETQDNWQKAVTTYGVCGKFVYDSAKKTVRLPKVTGIIEGTTDVNALGDLVEAGLPNITADWNSAQYDGGWGTSNGAVYGILNNSHEYNSGSSGMRAYFDASRSSSIYGNSTTVQPQTIKAFYYIIVATSTKTGIQVDIDEIATDLNGKVDKADLAEVQCVVETYQKGTSWYRIWSDGWCEQGARVPQSNNDVNVSVTFLKAYKDTNYYINLTSNTTDNTFNGSQPNWVNSRTETGFSAHIDCYGTDTHDWQACGYIA